MTKADQRQLAWTCQTRRALQFTMEAVRRGGFLETSAVLWRFPGLVVVHNQYGSLTEMCSFVVFAISFAAMMPKLSPCTASFWHLLHPSSLSRDALLILWIAKFTWITEQVFKIATGQLLKFHAFLPKERSTSSGRGTTSTFGKSTNRQMIFKVRSSEVWRSISG